MGSKGFSNHIRCVRLVEPPDRNEGEKVLLVSKRNLSGQFLLRKAKDLQSIVFTLIY
jgi:hypothetical protein